MNEGIKVVPVAKTLNSEQQSWLATLRIKAWGLFADWMKITPEKYLDLLAKGIRADEIRIRHFLNEGGKDGNAD